MRLNRSGNEETSKHFCERRARKRLLCSDLIQVGWTDSAGATHSEVAILENLSTSGVGVFMGVKLSTDCRVLLSKDANRLTGIVRQCAFRENGYLVGIELDTHSDWAQQPGSEFVPEHLLDLSLLDLN